MRMNVGGEEGREKRREEKRREKRREKTGIVRKKREQESERGKEEGS
jgi:hypothetical protein